MKKRDSWFTPRFDADIGGMELPDFECYSWQNAGH